MKKLLYLLTFTICFIVVAQNNNKIKKKEWHDPAVYQQVADPQVKVFGPLSDSLSNEFSGTDFLFHKGMYFAVSNAADYYLWYTQRFPDQFSQPVSIYAQRYLEQDNKEMIQFIQVSYLGEDFPVDFKRVNNPTTNLHYGSVTMNNYYNGFYVGNAGILETGLEGSVSRFVRMNAPPVVPSSK